MSRSGYVYDMDNWKMIKWRGRVASAIRGKRGQALLRDLLAALDAMPVKRLVCLAKEIAYLNDERCDVFTPEVADVADKTKIQWTDASWNPVRGCSRVSDGCRHCYAERVAARFSGPGQPYEGLARMASRGHPDVIGSTDPIREPRWTGEVRMVPEQLDQPLRWKRPRRVFVASMSDPFHAGFSDDEVDSIFAVMALADWHAFQLLTKRADRMRAYASDPERPFKILRAIDRIEVDRAMRDVTEEWHPVPSCPLYEVSNHGRVRREARELSLADHSRGYKQVALCENGSPRTALVHRLVLEAFDRRARDGEEAAHRNGDRADNRIANLRWATKGENMQDAARQGTAGVWMKGRATLTATEVADIRAARGRGEKLETIATRFGIDKRQVSAVARGAIFKPAPLPWPLPNVWLGVSVENQETADERIPLLLETPAAVRFVSAEPLLGPVDLVPFLDLCCEGCGEYDGRHADPTILCGPVSRMHGGRLSWVICGGESGPGARPCDVAWIRSIVVQCRDAGVPAFVKQLGAKPVWGLDVAPLPAPQSAESIMRHGEYDPEPEWLALRSRKGDDPAEWPEDLRVQEFPIGGAA